MSLRFASFLLLATLAACRRGGTGAAAARAADSTPPSREIPAPPPEREANDVGGLMLFLAQLPVSSFTFADFRGQVLDPGIPGCPTVTSTQDRDQDGIPDEATYTFSPGPCTTVAGGYRTVETGTVTIRDPGAGYGYMVEFKDFRRVQQPAAGGTPLTITLNGSHTLRGTGKRPVLAVNTVTVYQGAPRVFNPHLTDSTSTVRLRTTYSYITDTGDPLVPNRQLVDGLFTVAGRVRLQAGARDYTLTVKTLKPFRYSPYCIGGPSPFPGGELSATAVGMRGVKGFRLAYPVDCRDAMEFEVLR